MHLIRALLVWLLIIAAETVHGILRSILLVPLVYAAEKRASWQHGSPLAQ